MLYEEKSMKESETTEMHSISSALKTTAEILEELIGGIIPEEICDTILGSRPQKDFIPQSDSRNNENSCSPVMSPHSEGQSKSAEDSELEVRKLRPRKISRRFPTYREFPDENYTKQRKVKKICSPPEVEEDLGDKQPCRVCREERYEKQMNSIFSDKKRFENLPFILKTLVDVEVTPDTEQPSLICALCLDTLIVFFSFYQKVKIAQYILKETLIYEQNSKSLASVSNNAVRGEVIPEGEVESQLDDPSSPMPCDSDDGSMNTNVSTENVQPIKLTKPMNEGINSGVSSRIRTPKDILVESPFSYYVNREISDEKWDHIYDVMTTTGADGDGSSLKVLKNCILDHPFAVDWHCIECQETISGGHAEYIDHSIQTHVWYPEQVKFPCDVCGVAFPLIDSAGTNESYCEHWLQHFFPKDCAVCQLKFVSHCELREHIKSIHEERLLKCDQCTEVFVSASELNVHKNIHAPSEVKKNKKGPFPCKICSKNVSDLWHHNKMYHFEETAWKCEDCDKKFLTRIHLKSHRSRVHPNIKIIPTFKCTVCGETFASQTLRTRHLIAIHRTRKKCGICDRIFRTQYQLNVHMLSHQSTGNCVCEICGKSLKGAKHLKEHMYIHSGEKPFECPICGIRIRMKSNLFKHMKSIHKTSLREYTESTATNSRTAMEADDVSVDVVSTEENQSLKCNDCGEIFESVEILQVHRTVVHFGKSQVVLKCDYCDETFDSKSAKGKHIEENHEKEIENNTTCVLCNKIYPNVRSYTGHLRRVHSGKQPVKTSCEICGKVFKGEGILKMHIRNVHIPNSFPCPLCPKKFQRQNLVTSHMRKEHKVTKSSAAVSNNTVGNEVITVRPHESQLEGRCSPMSYHSDQDDSLNTPISTVKLSPVKFSKPLREGINSDSSSNAKNARDILAKSSFSHFVNREISDEKWEHICTLMTSSPVDGSNFKVLDECIRYHPFARDWHCIECKKTISGGHREFIDHSIQVHEVSTSDQVMFPCDVCGLVFPMIDSTGTTESYCGHWTKHFSPKDAAVESDNISSAVVGAQENQSLRCNDCGDAFETIEILGAHRESVHVKLRKGRAPVMRKCEYCDECFDTAPSKKKHITEKHPEKLDESMTCAICNKIYRNRLSHNAHVWSVHSGKVEEKVPCETCGKIFTSKQILKTHIKTIHNGSTTNSVPCPLCPSKFRRQDLVWSHMRNTHKMTMAEYRKSLASSDTTSITEKK